MEANSPDAIPASQLEDIPEIPLLVDGPADQVVRPAAVHQHRNQSSVERSFYSSNKYSATGGTGGHASFHRKFKSPTKVLGDYQMVMINKALKDF